MKYLEEIMMDSRAVRNVCVEHQWYTAGDNKSYGNMFDMVYAFEYSVEALQKIAEDIVDHTPEDHEDWEYRSHEDRVAYVMFVLRNECCRSVFFMDREDA